MTLLPPDRAGRDENWTFRAIVDELPDLVCQFHPDSTLLYVNRAYAAFHGREPDDLVGTSFLDLVPSEFRPPVEANLERLVQAAFAEPVVVNEHLSRDARGRVRWIQWTDKAMFDAAGGLDRFLTVGRDVTERHEAEDRLTELVGQDPLTGLVNRRRALEELGARLALVRPGSSTGVLFCDLDGFKAVNDTEGHAAGDRVLCSVAGALTAAVRGGDLVARVGGDEFVVICDGLGGRSELGAVVSRIRLRLAAAVPSVSVSIGAALARPGERVDEVLGRADADMYEDKRRWERAGL